MRHQGEYYRSDFECDFYNGLDVGGAIDWTPAHWEIHDDGEQDVEVVAN